MRETIKAMAKSFWQYFTGRKSSWRFAKGCLIIGGSLVAGPLWLPFVVATIESHTSVKINEPSPWLGLVIIGFGLLAVIIPELAEQKARNAGENDKQKSQRMHDSNYAKTIRDLMPQDRFEWFMTMIGDTHTMRQSDLNMLRAVENEITSDEKGFIDVDMKNCADRFRKAISSVINFSALNFFPPDNFSIREEFWMFPAGNWDRGAPTPEQEQQYGRLRLELNELLDELENSRKEFLTTAREKLLLVDSK